MVSPLLYQVFYRIGFTPWDGHAMSPALRTLIEGPAALSADTALDIGCGGGLVAEPLIDGRALPGIARPVRSPIDGLQIGTVREADDTIVRAAMAAALIATKASRKARRSMRRGYPLRAQPERGARAPAQCSIGASLTRA